MQNSLVKSLFNLSSHNNEVTVLLFPIFLTFFWFIFQQIGNSGSDHKFFLTFCVGIPLPVQFSKLLLCYFGSVSYMLHSRLDQFWDLDSDFRASAIFVLGLSWVCTSSLFPMGLVPSHINKQQSSSPALSSITLLTLSLKEVLSFCPLARIMEFLLGFCMSFLPWLLQLHFWGHP